ncbi:MAG: hypothetical protein EXR86_07135 [Gammaproteobacteria bacterium]|nr:hypothetical protein [Gammaproteobacteria bacterium]
MPSLEAAAISQVVDPRQFRRALGNFATGVTVVTTVDPAGAYIGVTASSFNSVSLKPPMILWSLDKDSLSRAAFEAASHFIVNVLSTEQVALSDAFAKRGTHKFRETDFVEGVDGVPLLTGCAATFQCRKTFIYEGGDHLILVGEVLAFAESGHEALLFYRGEYSVSRPHPRLRRTSTHASSSFVGDYLDYLLSQAAAKFQTGFESILQREHLRQHEWRVLVTLGDRDQGIGAGELALVDLISSDEADEILDQLRTRGWVAAARAPDGSNLYHLTGAGHAKLVPMQAAASAFEADLLGCFSAGEARQLKDMLKRLILGSAP